MAGSSRTWFDEVAPGFAGYSQSAPYRQRVDAFLQLASAAPAPGGRAPRCLDLGCGAGGLSVVFAARGYEVVGVDASPQMLAHAREAATREKLEITFIEGDLTEELPAVGFDPDLIVCSSVLEYVEHPQEVVARCARALAPAGVLLVSVPNARSLPRLQRQVRYWLLRRRTYLDQQQSRISARELARSGEADGLELIGIRHFSAPARLTALARLPFIGTLSLLAMRKPG